MQANVFATSSFPVWVREAFPFRRLPITQQAFNAWLVRLIEVRDPPRVCLFVVSSKSSVSLWIGGLAVRLIQAYTDEWQPDEATCLSVVFSWQWNGYWPRGCVNFNLTARFDPCQWASLWYCGGRGGGEGSQHFCRHTDKELNGTL